MTFQEAQTRFTDIVRSISLTLTIGELNQKHADLQALLASLPNTPEYDPIATAIGEFSPKLKGQLTNAVMQDLRSRDTVMRETSGLLGRVADKASNDARTLSFDKPRMVVAALTESATTLQQIREAARAGDLAGAAAKAEALAILLDQVRTTIRG